VPSTEKCSLDKSFLTCARFSAPTMKLRGDVAVEQPVAVFAERAGVPYRVIHGQPDEPTEQQVVVRAAPSAAAPSARSSPRMSVAALGDPPCTESEPSTVVNRVFQQPVGGIQLGDDAEMSKHARLPLCPIQIPRCR
jgi:hypothetical protein